MTADRARTVEAACDGIDAIGRFDYRDDYSGRGMSGATCPAVVVESVAHLVALGMSIAYEIASNADGEDGGPTAADLIDDAIREFGRVRVDSLGRDVVAYWPGLVRPVGT